MSYFNRHSLHIIWKLYLESIIWNQFAFLLLFHDEFCVDTFPYRSRVWGQSVSNMDSVLRSVCLTFSLILSGVWEFKFSSSPTKLLEKWAEFQLHSLRGLSCPKSPVESIMINSAKAEDVRHVTHDYTLMCVCLCLCLCVWVVAVEGNTGKHWWQLVLETTFIKTESYRLYSKTIKN